MRLLLVSYLIFISLFLQAQDTEIDLDPVTVTATLQPQPVSRTGRNITTIPGHYFEKFPVHSVDELLRFIPGVEVQMRGPSGSQSDIVLRGGTFQQVLVVVDGIRLNDPNTGHFSSYIPIAPGEIEKIEVLKGASSAIFGSEAVGGVINIITKSFAARKDRKRKDLHVSATGGEYKFLNASAGGSWQNNKTAIAGGVLTSNSDGQPQRGTRGFFHNHTASLSLKQFISENWSLSARTSYDSRDFSAQNFYTTFASDTANEKVTTNWIQANVNYQKGKHNFSIDAGYKSVRDKYRFNPRSTANDNKSYLWQLLATEHFQVTSNTMVSGGLQFQNRKIRSNDRGNHSLKQIAGFIILTQRWESFSFSPSIRVDHSQRRGTEFIPQLNLSYRLLHWQLRASAGKTIREADFTERFNNYNKALVTGGSIGNPDLKAERSFSYEIGADYFTTKDFKLSATAFQRRHNQLIDWITTPYSQMPRKDNLSPSGVYALALNIAKVTTTGVEADLHFNKNLGGDNRVISTLGLLWLETQGDNTTASFYISSHARFLANFNAEWMRKKFAVSVNGIYKNRKPQQANAINARIDKNSFLANARLSFFALQQRLRIFAEVDNVFDSSVGDLLGTQLPGRWLMGGCSFSLY